MPKAKKVKEFQPLFSEAPEDDGTVVPTADLEGSPEAAAKTNVMSVAGSVSPDPSSEPIRTPDAPSVNTSILHTTETPVLQPVPPEDGDETPFTRDDMVARLNEILVPNGKRGLPSLVGFDSPTANARRYVIIDVNDGVLMDAYKEYLEHYPENPEEFLACVYDAMQSPVPRLYRFVVPVNL